MFFQINRTRGRDGKFVKTLYESEEEADGIKGFKTDLNSLTSYVYRIFRIIPFILLAYLIWRYFKVAKLVLELLLELTSGEGCQCSCPDL